MFGSKASKVLPELVVQLGEPRATSEPDQHDSGEETEHQTDQELVNAVASKGEARPEGIDGSGTRVRRIL